MKTSVCITVFNEEKNINKLLNSLLSQTKVPDQIIIVDGGSTDKTIQKIEKYKKVRLIISKGASIAKGRNLAVKNAKYSIIAMTDAGCVCEKHWLERITKSFSKNADIIAGFYKMTGSLNFQKALKPFLGVLPDRYDKNEFLPSTRSIAFKKSAWEKVGGFDEKFDHAGEDYDLNLKFKNWKLKIKSSNESFVYWEVPDNLVIAFKKFFYYARGDAQSGKFTSSHNIHTLSIFIRYILLISLLFLLKQIDFAVIIMLIYSAWAFSKSYKYGKNWRVGLWGVIIQVGSDFSVMAGFISGVWAILNK